LTDHAASLWSQHRDTGNGTANAARGRLAGTSDGRASPRRQGDRPRGRGRYRLAPLLGILAWLVAGAASAGERWTDLAETVFQNYGREQGMPHPVPTSLAQDGDGFVWAGTQGGLTRWDGYRFRGYLPDPAAPDSLPDNWIQTVHADRRRRLWIGTGAGGLARYDREHDDFIRYPAGPQGLSHAHVGAIADDGADALWIGTDGGLDHLDIGSGRISVLHHDERDPGSLPSDRVQSVLQDRAGRLWVGTAAGLVRREPAQAGFRPVRLTPAAEPPPSVTALFEDEAGRTWIGTARHGAYILDGPAAEPRPVVETAPGGSTLEREWVSTIQAANAHEVWIGTRGAGIVVVDTDTFRSRRIRHDPTLARSLAHDDVWALLLDAEGSMWVAGTGGLSYRARDPGTLATLFGASNRPDGVSEADVYAIMAASDGRVWLGFLSGGVDIVDPLAGRVARLRPDPTGSETALPNDIVSSMAEIPGGDVYVATLRGLYRTDRTGGKVALVRIPGRDPHVATSVLLVDAGSLWIGGRLDGLWRLGTDGAPDPRFDRALSERLTDQRITSLLRGKANDLWVGTRNGLNRLDLATGAVEQITPDPANPTALISRYIASMLFDRQGRLWVGTFGGGIAVMTGRGPDGRPVFHRLGLAEGLPHLNIDTVLLDGGGMIWTGTDDGLAVIDPDSFAIHALHRAEGSVLADYFVHSGEVDTAGEALFGAKGGVTVVRSDRVEPWDFRPRIVATEIRAGGLPVPAGRFNDAGSAEPVVLTPGADSIVVEFSALDYTSPERNRYAYRLEGYDRDWIQADATRRVAAYTNLPPGDYTLRARGSNRDGVWGEAALAVPVRVLPAWYQTLWFRTALALAGLVSVATLIQARTAYLRERQAVLERRVAERTAELQQRTDELAEAHRQLEEIAYVDALTGLPNRRMFTEEFRRLIAQAKRRGAQLTLLLLDLDRFKWINDTFGHDAGDALLVAAASRFKAATREADFIARLGGDEFAILLVDSALPELVEPVCRRILDSFADPIPFQGQAMTTSASIGVALYPDHGDGEETLFKAADLALYAAKRAGRNTWRWHGAETEA
jgi:diguanylate cyclase (GGDEF)-like protein